MPFHVEIRRSLHRARVFNLDAAELSGRVLASRGHAAGLSRHRGEHNGRRDAARVRERRGALVPLAGGARGHGRARGPECLRPRRLPRAVSSDEHSALGAYDIARVGTPAVGDDV